MPMRVTRFTAWLRDNGEPAPSFVGDNWYEVERAAAGRRAQRAAFTLDDLPPSDDEFATWLRWLELAREELADPRWTTPIRPRRLSSSTPSSARTSAFVRDLGRAAPELTADPIDRLYASREALTDALEAAGPYHDGVRRMLRLAIADDLRAAEALRRPA